jgi:hypothetical protein
VLYILLVFGYYIAKSKFLISSAAMLLYLSMKTVNLWAIIFSVLTYHTMQQMILIVSAALVIAGVFVYEMGNRASSTDTCCCRVKSRRKRRPEVDSGEVSTPAADDTQPWQPEIEGQPNADLLTAR